MGAQRDSERQEAGADGGQEEPGPHFGGSKLGEAVLSDWLRSHLSIAWVCTDDRLELERHLISTVDLPLNLEGNERHPFHTTLTALRSEASRRARRSAA